MIDLVLVTAVCSASSYLHEIGPHPLNPSFIVISRSPQPASVEQNEPQGQVLQSENINCEETTIFA